MVDPPPAADTGGSGGEEPVRSDFVCVAITSVFPETDDDDSARD